MKTVCAWQVSQSEDLLEKLATTALTLTLDGNIASARATWEGLDDVGGAQRAETASLFRQHRAELHPRMGHPSMHDALADVQAREGERRALAAKYTNDAAVAAVESVMRVGREMHPRQVALCYSLLRLFDSVPLRLDLTTPAGLDSLGDSRDGTTDSRRGSKRQAAAKTGTAGGVAAPVRPYPTREWVLENVSLTPQALGMGETLVEILPKGVGLDASPDNLKAKPKGPETSGPAPSGDAAKSGNPASSKSAPKPTGSQLSPAPEVVTSLVTPYHEAVYACYASCTTELQECLRQQVQKAQQVLEDAVHAEEIRAATWDQLLESLAEC
jgi:hypothetical protein